MLKAKQKIITPREYFEIEETAEYKSEYYQGEIFAMSGASHNHNLIAINIIASLHNILRNSDCVIYGSDMKVQVDESLHYTYPDASIVCGEIRFAKSRDDIITNPLVIFEILSESTKDYDRGSKFTAYRKIRSLRDYIIVDQYEYHVEYFYKDASDKWSLEEFTHSDDKLTIRGIGSKLSLNTIYERVKWQKASF
jgi:Uma2 family endonuclease